MGSSNFFAKFASIDPLAQALHLPGANKYAQQEAENANNTSGMAVSGPYAGEAPTLAGANAGYAPGGPGSNSNYTPFKVQQPGGLFGGMQRISSAVGDTTPNLGNGQVTPASPSGIGQTLRTGQPAGTANPYITAAPGSPGAQAGMNPYISAAANANSNALKATTGGMIRGY
jgi:hypothetical protein